MNKVSIETTMKPKRGAQRPLVSKKLAQKIKSEIKTNANKNKKRNGSMSALEAEVHFFKKQVNGALKSRKMTREGRRWLTTAIDPFHDTDVKLAGYPDPEGRQTLVFEAIQSMNIIPPPGLASTDTWDTHVVFLPELTNTLNYNNMSVGTVVRSNGSLFPSIAQTLGPSPAFFNYGPISAFSVPSGQPTFPTLPIGSWSAPTVTTMDWTRYLTGATRLIGGGFEVINDSSFLNNQGGCLVYRMPQEVQSATFSVQATPELNSSLTTTQYLINTATVSAMPPSTPADAIAYTNSFQWPGKEGAYCVLTQTTTNNPLVVNRPDQRIFVKGPLDAETPYFGSTGYPYITTIPTDTPYHVVTSFANDICHPVPFNTTGCMMLNLQAGASIVVNARFYFEMAPYEDNLLQAMATPSGAFDPVALEVYSHVMARIPAGVKQGMNGSGDYWKMLLGIISEVAPIATPILGAAFGPVGLVAGGLAKGMADAAIRYTSRQDTLPKSSIATNTVRDIVDAEKKKFEQDFLEYQKRKTEKQANKIVGFTNNNRY